jgi:response regulator RpfG family c-di-GMP phosphodiesterase
MSEIKIAVIDDDWYKREAMKEVLNRSDRIAVVHAISQDQVSQWTDEEWDEVDLAIVDVYDDGSPLEVGTDMFSGIAALERLRDLNVRTFAVMPHRHHPLVEHRVHQSGANHLYRRWELNDPDFLAHVLLNPDDQHVPEAVKAKVLRRYGADLARINRAVAAYEQSELYGKLYATASHRTLKMRRRAIDSFVVRVRNEKVYAPVEQEMGGYRAKASWLDVRDFLLRAIGRQDAPPSQGDEHTDLWREVQADEKERKPAKKTR